MRLKSTEMSKYQPIQGRGGNTWKDEGKEEEGKEDGGRIIIITLKSLHPQNLLLSSFFVFFYFYSKCGT